MRRKTSIVPGLYDGLGGFEELDASIEKHLAKIESAAAAAIRKLDEKSQEATTISPEIWRFLSWQAARTPGWMEIEEDWVYEWDPNVEIPVVEPPPEGFEQIRDRNRLKRLENPDTGETHDVRDRAEFRAYRSRGWKWLLSSADRLEMLHMQAWYFQVRHFPRLSWIRLTAPTDSWFVLSDRGVAWMADGYTDTPPAALRHPKVQVVAPLTRKIALVGRNQTQALRVTPREVNRFTACIASNWIVGPTRTVVEQAIRDRVDALKAARS